MTSFADVCAGISASSMALHPIGWRPAWKSEIEPFPCAVLAYRFPNVVNHGDMTTLPARVLRGEVEAPDVVIAGTPCQGFSIAGLRGGLSDPRGLLTLRFVELVNAVDHVRTARGDDECILWWENVPGVLSDKDNAFGHLLAALVGESEPLVPPGWKRGERYKWPDAGCVYGPRRTVAWRVLDAQYFGLAQRRRRVFVVGSARDGLDPSVILFEREVLRRDSPPRREAPEDVAGTITASAGGSDENDAADGRLIPALARCVTTGEAKRQDWETCTIIPWSKTYMADDYKDGTFEDADTARPLTTSADRTRAAPIVATELAVRRLTARECERLQGFPDDYTRIPWRGKPVEECPDGPRYKALGNSMAVPVMRWIGSRIDAALRAQERAA